MIVRILTAKQLKKSTKNSNEIVLVPQQMEVLPLGIKKRIF
jgi:hypothetical protein